MRGDVDTIKERLDIVEVISGYTKLEKAGINFKARCPFHNEKTPSFFVSPSRQSFYCFGCGAKGDIFTFVEDIEGIDFKGALKMLAEKAGVELEYHPNQNTKTEKEKIFNILEVATLFFEKNLTNEHPAREYLMSRGLKPDTIKNWRLGYAPKEWRALHDYLKELGYDTALMLKAGLVKVGDVSTGKEPYDVFRARIIFPLADSSGRIIAFSGRALSQDTEPKYLNSPDTTLFTKSEVLYGLDRAKNHIRKKNYAVLVEGQMDLLLSHQTGVDNTVATSGTALTGLHLERLRKLSSRIIFAFDGDEAGTKAAERASVLGLNMGFEIKVAALPKGSDPAEVARQNPDEWKDILRRSLIAPEHFLDIVMSEEKDQRKLGKQIEKKILPMVKLVKSAIERSHFISLISKRTGIKEAVLWEDLARAEKLGSANFYAQDEDEAESPALHKSYREQIEERLVEIKLWREELPESFPEVLELKKEELELLDNLSALKLHEELEKLSLTLSTAEKAGDEQLIVELTGKVRLLHDKIRTLEENRKLL